MPRPLKGAEQKKGVCGIPVPGVNAWASEKGHKPTVFSRCDTSPEVDDEGGLMNCFNHRDKPAIGVCKSCGKGICGDCAAECHNGLVCKETCGQKIEPTDNSAALNPLIQKSRDRKIMLIIYSAIAVAIVLLSIYAMSSGNDFLGRVLLGVAIYMLIVGVGRFVLEQRKDQSAT
jgi:hypothetical protein